MSPDRHAPPPRRLARESPRVTIYHNDRAAARALARRIAEAVAANPRIVLGLPTGRTPVALYNELASLAARGAADFSQITTFNLDEFVGIPASHPGSYRTFMQQHFFSLLHVAPEHVHFLNGTAEDLAAECARYEREIADAGGIDLQILGIGTNGHIGFNEPAPELDARTHRVTLKPETRRSNAALFGGDESQVPKEALSMGMGTILRARSIVLLATGASKASCIDRVINGGVTTTLPASFLQLHGATDVMLDEAAGGQLKG
jgi:glucosamine-6-phosphate deaminase